MTYLFPESVLLIFCKAPIAGQVKTRLQPGLTAEQAASAHGQLTRMSLARAFKRPLCPVELYCAPDVEHDFFQDCARDYPLRLVQQTGHDLGQRMAAAFAAALSEYRQVVLMGSDCPSLTADDIHQALRVLQNGHDVVIAPAVDGGYVLIGLCAMHTVLFEDIAWSSSGVMSQTLHRARDAGLNIYELQPQWDVDRFEDWQRYLSEFRQDRCAE